MAYDIIQADATRVFKEGDGKSRSLVETLSTATTLTAADSGKTFLLAAVGKAIDLPALSAGLEFTFILKAATITTNWTIVSSTDVIEGYAAVNYATILANNENTISFVATKGIIGDKVTVVCDGTSWYANGVASVAATITFTAPA